MSELISFVATVAKVQTLVDGGIRVTFDMSEANTMQMAQLAECKRFEAILRIVATVEQENDRGNPRQSRKIHI